MKFFITTILFLSSCGPAYLMEEADASLDLQGDIDAIQTANGYGSPANLVPIKANDSDGSDKKCDLEEGDADVGGDQNSQGTEEICQGTTIVCHKRSRHHNHGHHHGHTKHISCQELRNYLDNGYVLGPCD